MFANDSPNPGPTQRSEAVTNGRETDADFREAVHVPAPRIFEVGWEALTAGEGGDGLLRDVRDAADQAVALFDLPVPGRSPFEETDSAGSDGAVRTNLSQGSDAVVGRRNPAFAEDAVVPVEPPNGSQEELIEYSFVRRKLQNVVHDYFEGPEDVDHDYVEIEVIEKESQPGDSALDVLESIHYGGIPSLIARMGAKSQLAKDLVQWFPRHHTYVEPFMGSCKVLFAKSTRSHIEVINDFDGDMVSFWRYVQKRPELLAKFINDLPTHEAIILGFREALGDRRLRGIQRAAAFYLGSQSVFNSKGDYSSYASSPQVRLDLSASVRDFQRVADRLLGVDIRSTGYARIIDCMNKRMGSQYSGPVFFYCDPPYWQTTEYETLQAETAFSWADQVKLADMMKQVTDFGNKFIITNSAHNDLYKLYKERGFFIEKRDVYYSVSGDADARKKAGEFIVSNFKLDGEKRQRGLF